MPHGTFKKNSLVIENVSQWVPCKRHKGKITFSNKDYWKKYSGHSVSPISLLYKNMFVFFSISGVFFNIVLCYTLQSYDFHNFLVLVLFFLLSTVMPKTRSSSHYNTIQYINNERDPKKMYRKF
jgi:hypothetical protein